MLVSAAERIDLGRERCLCLWALGKRAEALGSKALICRISTALHRAPCGNRFHYSISADFSSNELRLMLFPG